MTVWKKLNVNQDQNAGVTRERDIEFWNFVWEVATSQNQNTLHDFEEQIRVLVLPLIEFTRGKQKLARDMQNQLDGTDSK